MNRYIIPSENRPKGRPRKTLKEREQNKLTRKQELFVKELVSKDGQITKEEAAIAAGYSKSSAYQRAYELTNPKLSPHVCKAIRQYRAELDAKYGVEFNRHLRDLQIIRDEALSAGAYSAAVQAEYRRGQAQGDIYVTKSEVRHGTIESMSKEEVMRALKELRDQYEAIDTVGVVISDEDDNQEEKGKLFLETTQNSAEKNRSNVDRSSD